MTALTMIITDAGRAALVDAGAGGTAAVHIVQVGLTDATFVAAPTLTALPGEFKRVASVAGLAVGNDTVHLVIRDSSTDTYSARAFGLYLDTGVLFAVYGQADPILGKAEVSTFLLAVDLRFLPGETDHVVFGDANFLNPPATETTMGVAYLATLAEALAGAVADKILTPAAMAAVLANYVKAEQLGIAGGVATLGPDGKLLVSQRPPIDLIDVWPVSNEAEMLALAATVGDFAVRADSGLVYVLQTAPATILANWLEISTPAPVSSVNGKVGAVWLGAGDVGAAPVGRTITGSGLVTGGGDLNANRTLNVQAATPEQADAGADGGVALTPWSIRNLLASLGGKVASGRSIIGSGLASGGGTLDADRVISVIAAGTADIQAGTRWDVAVTPGGLASLPKSLTPNGYVVEPSGLIWQWVQYRGIWTSEGVFSVSWPIVFPRFAFVGAATGWLSYASGVRDLWPQLVTPSQYGTTIQLQSDDTKDQRIDGVDIIMLGC